MATVTPSVNGKPQRKQLSEQLDRLDGIIDCLAEALPEAVGDATREGTRLAIREMFLEMLTDPQILERLRSLIAPHASNPAPTPSSPEPNRSLDQPRPGPFARLKSAARTIASKLARAIPHRAHSVVAKVKSICGRAKERLQGMASTVVQTVRTLKSGMPLGRIAGVAVGVGVTVAIVSYCAPQSLSATLSGVGAACTAAAIQVGGWVRRSFRAFGLGTS